MKEEKNSTGITAFSRLHHVTVVVKDIEKSVQFYESLGLGPFTGPEATHEVTEKTLRGKPLGANRVLVREASIGSVVLQLVQYIDGEHLVKEFVDRKEEGVFHLGFDVDDVNEAEEQIVKLGLKVTQRGRRKDGSGYAFFDTEEHAGVVLQIRESPRKS